CDWIIEAVIEQLEVKQALFERVERLRRPDAIVSSNTSGIPIAALAEGRSDGFRRHFLGTHFFNPPRYLRLVEIIPLADTDPSVVEAISVFAEHRLGKGVVIARDTPNFIANHLGLYSVLRMFRALEQGDLTIEEIDAITGPAIGRPKSATFRTMDIAGIDVLAHVARNLAGRLETDEARQAFAVPALVERMVERGWIGAKSGQGFYRKTETGDILTLDPATMEYRPRQPVRLPELDAARGIEDLRERVARLTAGENRVGQFLRDTLVATLDYAERIAPDVAYSTADVDRAMRWGFGWELGPFELRGAPPPVTLIGAARAAGVVRRNAGCSLVDLGDDVLGIEFHSKMNTIGGDTIDMLQAGLAEASRNFAAVVIANDAVNFSVGANLMLLLLEAQEENWDEIDLMIRGFQRATMAIRLADVPVVVAPAGLSLGGGCEIALHADRVQAAAETYMGLVEVGVGVIPGGGGTKEMLARAMESAPPGADALPFVQRVFETIGFGKVSTSGADARRHGYLRDADAITMNREHLAADAKATALARARSYVPPQPRPAIPVGGEGVLAALKLGVHLAWRAGRISEHDALIGRKLAWILAGGSARPATTLSERQLLDLEREAFLSLCGERKTQDRIAHTLKTGKPLRN
ncbi:MAG: 3-hydroxyacyl-CoA dehydrogenase/enoyl-CoA hydratase family protein, partial [Acidobacteriota bacterium]